jgi:predicted metal-dependent peptidase
MAKKSSTAKNDVPEYMIPLSDEKEKAIVKLIQKTRITLLIDFPFFGILSLKLVLKKDYSIPTMATEGKHLLYNPNFVEKLPEKQLAFIIVHEVMHCALRHIWRKGDKNHIKWNYACDYAIHSILNSESISCIEMPQGALYNRDYNNMSAEEIYTVLPDDVGNNGNGTLDDHDVWEKNSNDGGDGSSTSNSDMEQDWESSVINAAKQVERLDEKKRGCIPGYFKRYIDSLLNPVKDWRILLREFIEPEPNDYTFIRPDYRIDYDTFGCFLPSFNDELESVNKILFWIDTSGSIGNDELNRIYSEVAGAIQQFDVFTGYLGFFDHVAYEPKAFTDLASLKDIEPVGGGGTNFHAPFEYVRDNDEFRGNVKCQIILTDGYCDYPDEEIAEGVPVIWLITTKSKVNEPPFGKSIYLPLNGGDEE